MKKNARYYLIILITLLSLMLASSFSYSQQTSIPFQIKQSTPYLIQLNKIDTGYVLSLNDVKKVNYAFAERSLFKKDSEFAFNQINTLNSYIVQQDSINTTILKEIKLYKAIVANKDTVINIQGCQIESLENSNFWNKIYFGGGGIGVGIVIAIIFL